MLHRTWISGANFSQIRSLIQVITIFSAIPITGHTLELGDSLRIVNTL